MRRRFVNFFSKPRGISIPLPKGKEFYLKCGVGERRCNKSQKTNRGRHLFHKSDVYDFGPDCVTRISECAVENGSNTVPSESFVDISEVPGRFANTQRSRSVAPDGGRISREINVGANDNTEKLASVIYHQSSEVQVKFSHPVEIGALNTATTKAAVTQANTVTQTYMPQTQCLYPETIYSAAYEELGSPESASISADASILGGYKRQLNGESMLGTNNTHPMITFQANNKAEKLISDNAFQKEDELTIEESLINIFTDDPANDLTRDSFQENYLTSDEIASYQISKRKMYNKSDTLEAPQSRACITFIFAKKNVFQELYRLKKEPDHDHLVKDNEGNDKEGMYKQVQGESREKALYVSKLLEQHNRPINSYNLIGDSRDENILQTMGYMNSHLDKSGQLKPYLVELLQKGRLKPALIKLLQNGKLKHADLLQTIKEFFIGGVVNRDDDGLGQFFDNLIALTVADYNHDPRRIQQSSRHQHPVSTLVEDQFHLFANLSVKKEKGGRKKMSCKVSLLLQTRQYRMNVIRAEQFDDAMRYCHSVTFTMDYTDVYPRNCRIVISIPVYRGGFINNKDRIRRGLPRIEY